MPKSTVQKRNKELLNQNKRDKEHLARNRRT